jgi:5'-3' exonuclease
MIMLRNKPEIVLIDADSILYQVTWADNSFAECRKLFDGVIHNIVEAVDASEAMVFIKGLANFRLDVDPEYKAHRSGSVDEKMQKRLDALYAYCWETYTPSDNGEADDYVGIFNKMLWSDGVPCVMAHIDKDLDQLKGLHYNFKKNTYYSVMPEDGYQFTMAQLLAGDSADGVKGIKGLGMTKSYKLLGTNIKTYEDTVVNTYRKKSTMEELVKTANLLMIRDNMDDLRPFTEEEVMARLKLENVPLDFKDWMNTNGNNEEATDTMDVPWETTEGGGE